MKEIQYRTRTKVELVLNDHLFAASILIFKLNNLWVWLHFKLKRSNVKKKNSQSTLNQVWLTVKLWFATKLFFCPTDKTGSRQNYQVHCPCKTGFCPTDKTGGRQNYITD